ncbi:ABC transporter ATP-binding protein [Jeotgalibacillus salarius]|uniref:ABC transporter ATP-binding protein n=1 Tax=Jeotgalibacillus salarius TaxID=546023 RepID=A0A4Y8LHR5_9BACL|nr:ABC transporter ATP-binding protein [Jeotgalibacillus salarius]TFE01707.1 ABC transporter ATP-binding protein [Jeotgalibacillus salarius]
MDSVRKINQLFEQAQKKKLLAVFLLMVFAALFETMSVGLIVPFVQIISDPQVVQDSAIFFRIYEFFNFSSHSAFVIGASLVFLSFFIFKNLFLTFFYYVQFRVLFNEQVRLSERLFRTYLMKPYVFHLEKNSSELVRNTNTEVQSLFKYHIIPIFTLLTELLITAFIFALLLIISPVATLMIVVILGTSVGLFLRGFNQKITQAGKNQQMALGGMIKWVNQGLGAGKEIKVSGKEEYFVKAYHDESKKYATALRFHELVQQVPRMFIETVMILTVLAVIVVVLFLTNNMTDLFSISALFGMAAFRLMPSINRSMSAVSIIRHSKPALDVIYRDLVEEQEEVITPEEADQELFAGQAMKIEVKDLFFHYPGSLVNVINGVNVSIPAGKATAFIGETGSGKTTLIDLLIGVLEPTEGTIEVNGLSIQKDLTSWHQKIGYIPQSIFLTDESIRSNVAFGIADDEIKDEAVWAALEKAALKKFVMNLPDQLDTIVGERGVKISGGQKQRIGIARALYHDPEILVMDEATSALDNETEQEIIRAVDRLKGHKTLLIIAHRLTTIQNCDLVVEMKDGKAFTNQVAKEVARTS